MNNQQSSSWEVRLGLLQIILVVGVMTGSMLAIFALGFSSGQDSGLDLARKAAMAELPRIPIVDDAPQESAGEASVESKAAESEIYAKLNDSGVRMAETAPVAVNDEGEDLSLLQKDKLTADKTLGEDKKGKQQIVRMLGAGTDAASPGDTAAGEPADDGKTLGALLKKEEQGSRAIVTFSEPEANNSKAVDPAVTREAATKVDAPAVTERKQEPTKEIAKVSVAKLTTTAQAATSSGRTDTRASDTRVVSSSSAAMPSIKEPIKKVESPKSKAAFVATLPKGWFVQLAAPKSATEAESMAAQLQSSGFPVKIEKAQVRGEHYFRIVVGPERSKEMAERLASQTLRDGGTKGDPFIRLVK